MKNISLAPGAAALLALLIIFFSAFAFAVSAFAAEVKVDASASVGVSAKDSDGDSSSGNAGVGVAAETKAEEQTQEGASDRANDGTPEPSVPGGIFQNNQSDIDFITKSSKGTDDDAREGEHDNNVSVRAVEVRGWDPDKKQTFLGTVKAHAEVKSGQDLENFATGVLLKDENIEIVSFNNSEIKVEYKAQGKLFGFIPHTYRETITVDAKAEASERVKVRFPWYRFLLTSDLSADDITKSLGDNLVNFNPLATGGTAVSANAEAEVSALAEAFETVSNVLKTKHDSVKNSINNFR